VGDHLTLSLTLNVTLTLTLLLTLSLTLNLTLTLFLTLNVTVIGLGGLPRFYRVRLRGLAIADPSSYGGP